MIEELYIATATNQQMTVTLNSGEIITGVAEVCTDPERAKIRTFEGLVWVPYDDVENVSRVLSMFH
ncbi:hypothetical protein [Paenibacillus sp. IHBB 10380]|uniref:hypothetical protein n=1 Tax=Paenibacillus sp. IHBB 10380 TaxID=1566358 RepID=UPI00118604C6|nr:hypothetical protein [Paenibacillus sp. IHBB 10380]